MWNERVIRRLAAGQHGVITRTQVLESGASAHELNRRLRSGRMEQRYEGVYYLDSIPPTWHTDVLAALNACGPEALASHRCAARLFDLDGVFGRVIEVTVPYLDSPEPPGIIVHRTRRPNLATTTSGLPVVDATKTVLDLAAILPEKTLRKVARSAIRKGHTTPEKLDLIVGEFGGRGVTGTRKTRRVISDVADDLSGSVAEFELGDLIFDAPIARPIQQLRVRLQDGANAYPDFSWPDRMRIIEVDGFGAHGTPEQLETDLRRQNALMDLGWEIRRFTATEVREEPQRVLAEIVRFINKPFCES